MSEKKDRELSEKELKKAAGGGQPYGTPERKGSKGPFGTDPKPGGAYGTPDKPPFGTDRPSKGKK